MLSLVFGFIILLFSLFTPQSHIKDDTLENGKLNTEIY